MPMLVQYTAFRIANFVDTEPQGRETKYGRSPHSYHGTQIFGINTHGQVGIRQSDVVTRRSNPSPGL